MTDTARSLPNRDHKQSSPSPVPRLGGPLQTILASVSTLQVALVLTQAILAGIGLDGGGLGAALHEGNSTVIAVVAVVQLITALLWWRPGRGKGRAPLLAAGLLAAVMMQMMIGRSGLLSVHIPLGIGILLGSLWLLRIALPWRRRES